MTTHPEINRMIEDPRLFDPVKYVELQPLQFRRDFQNLADVINPMNEQGWPENAIDELTSAPKNKYERLLQFEIENIQSVGGERELTETEMERAEKNVRLQMFNTNMEVRKLSNYLQGELRKLLT